ncbi:RNA-directed DNA polymerase [Ectothiorhodospira variabilis]|uniref:RNA-directed DNA polymerase n=1 Tax=Ectothiorhodospira variabilis TaxID=505694 RepID=UPI001EFB4411|nr:RNA-directed DNA polymerase [Ectothiorhodospira variabilis]MCG5495911.1 RNA-directed DNA polymerase [Ectothiorhodospira variabilis]MCG5503020.1 RNA-directed DNA polymerase [Ectothiorhodospira variabilis]MCG5508469.1 RNA-directed DNA polymerase [Ectothiorhodospira variabilis]
MHTDRFRKLRKESLSSLFDKKEVSSVWRKIVRGQLRSLDFKDLYDHYDFNYNIEDRATAIRNEILNGTYRVSLPLIYRLEKKFGVCRHIVIPQPIDALVLQVLVESIAEQIIKHQPSDKSFYSRDKHNVGKPHDAAEYGLSFRSQWKKLQKEIYRFNDEKELLIVTDLSNYYDSISIEELKKVFLGYVENNEVLVDILFRVIEEISWKPDYLPYTGRGLPTSNLEAIRLLAHSFLFEIDEVLKQRAHDSFTRWMDDIVIGVDSWKEAIELISSISDMLKSRGLALNLSKTAIYDSKEAHYHFQIDENKYLDSLEGIKKGDANYKQATTDLKKNFKKHLKDHGPKYWDKIAKRYITAFGKLESTKLLTEISRVYLNYPGLRPNLLYYLSRIGYKKQTAQKVEEILLNVNVFDDISLYQISSLVTSWEVPVNDTSKEFLQKIDATLVGASFKSKNPADFYSVLWFKAKYDHSEELLKFIKKYQNLWQADSFLRRQVTAVMGRLLITNSKEIESLLYTQISSGVANTVSLANQIQRFCSIDSLDGKLRFYLFPKNVQKPYPLPKFMVLCSVLNSEKVRTDDGVRKSILEHVKDPYYRKWLDAQYNVN